MHPATFEFDTNTGLCSSCKTCNKSVPLRLNPRVLGMLIDETGSVSGSCMVWSDEAWHQLFGRPVVDIAKSNVETLRDIECRLLFLKVAFVFGWLGQIQTTRELARAGRRRKRKEEDANAQDSRGIYGRICVLKVLAL